MLITRASSINRALDQIGDKWCLLILQEVFWGIHSFNEMAAMIGVSKGVLSGRLKWLQEVDCLRKDEAGTRPKYHLTSKSVELYEAAMMAVAWEREFNCNEVLDDVDLIHSKCGHAFRPLMACHECQHEVRALDVQYVDGPGSCRDERAVKVRRRSSISVLDNPSNHNVYKHLVHIVGDRWTSNVIALAFHGIKRFDDFLRELPVATNILTSRLKFLVAEGVFSQVQYQSKPPRSEYQLTAKGSALFPYFLSLLHWGDKWCDPNSAGAPMLLKHVSCGQPLRADVICSECRSQLAAHEVKFNMPQVADFNNT